MTFYMYVSCILSLFIIIHFLLIGLDDRKEEGNFTYIDGSNLGSFHRWAAGHPLTLPAGDTKDCTVMAVNDAFQWVNVDCKAQRNFVCKIQLDKIVKNPQIIG